MAETRVRPIGTLGASREGGRVKRFVVSLAFALLSACQWGQAPTPGAGAAAASGGGSAGTLPNAGDRPALAAPLAETTSDVSGLVIRVLSLTRVAPNIVELRLELRNIAAALVDLEPLSAAGPWLAESSVATTDGQRRFFVLRDSSGTPSASEPPTALEPGQTATIVVKFGAVPADVTTLEFTAAHIEPVRGLSIQP
jgi:hypothetical protein